MKALIIQSAQARADAGVAGIQSQWPDPEVLRISREEGLERDLLDGVELVTVDCGKPGGATYVSEIREWHQVPIVVTGAADDLPAMAEAMEAGATEWLVVDAQAEAMVPLMLKRTLDAFGLGQEMAELRRQLAQQEAAIAEKEREIRELERSRHDLSTSDTLTGLVNRRHLATLLRREFERLKRYGFPISCLMIDIDHFRHINNSHGFPVGDLVLRRISEILIQHGRHSDVVARYGGEEFAVLLPHTAKAGGLVAAERIREAVAEKPITVNGEELPVTVSVGLASFPDEHIESVEHLIHEAEKALRKAKADGRNRTCAQGKDPRIEE